MIDIQHLQLVIQEINGWKNSIPVKTIGVQITGLEIGGGHKAHAVFKKCVQQAMQNHRVGDVGDEALMLAQSRLHSKKIQVTKLLANPLTLCVDKQQILQVLLNIINNAVDVLPADGTIRVTTGIHQADGQTELPGRRFGVIEIADNGPGIPVAVRARLFDPFFTTKRDGTGLGLSISQKIVRDHEGYITVSSVEGLGAAFQVHLPLN